MIIGLLKLVYVSVDQLIGYVDSEYPSLRHYNQVKKFNASFLNQLPTSYVLNVLYLRFKCLHCKHCLEEMCTVYALQKLAVQSSLWSQEFVIHQILDKGTSAVSNLLKFEVSQLMSTILLQFQIWLRVELSQVKLTVDDVRKRIVVLFICLTI